MNSCILAVTNNQRFLISQGHKMHMEFNSYNE